MLDADVEELVKLAGLKAIRDADNTANPILELNWATAGKWNETRRYTRTSEADARKLYEAITDPNHGVLSWIKRHW
jgi:hypothetical protein